MAKIQNFRPEKNKNFDYYRFQLANWGPKFAALLVLTGALTCS